MKQVTFKVLGMKIILSFSVAALEMEDSETTPSRFWGEIMNSNLKFYKPKLNKYEGRIKTFSDRQSLKFYFPYILYQEAARGCVPPNEESKSRKRKEGMGSENQGIQHRREAKEISNLMANGSSRMTSVPLV